MKKSTLSAISILILLVLVVFAYGAFKKNTVVTNQKSVSTPSTNKEPSSTQVEPTNFTANFEIYTNGTKRIFTDAKYHNQSPDVYITSSEPSKIYIKAASITWDDFFKTLPFSVTKDCLITGTKQTFCTNDARKLKFFINQTEIPNALDLEIKQGDFLKIIYGD